MNVSFQATSKAIYRRCCYMPHQSPIPLQTDPNEPGLHARTEQAPTLHPPQSEPPKHPTLTSACPSERICLIPTQSSRTTRVQLCPTRFRPIERFRVPCEQGACTNAPSRGRYQRYPPGRIPTAARGSTAYRVSGQHRARPRLAVIVSAEPSYGWFLLSVFCSAPMLMIGDASIT